MSEDVSWNLDYWIMSSPVCRSVLKMCTCTSYSFNGNYSKLCILALIIVWKFTNRYYFYWSIFAVVALFTKNIFIIKLYTQLLLHFQWEFLKSLPACLLLSEDSLIATAVLLDHMWRGFYPFSLVIFSSKSCSFNSYILNRNSSNLSIFAYINIRVCI